MPPTFPIASLNRYSFQGNPKVDLVSTVLPPAQIIFLPDFPMDIYDGGEGDIFGNNTFADISFYWPQDQESTQCILNFQKKGFCETRCLFIELSIFNSSLFMPFCNVVLICLLFYS